MAIERIASYKRYSKGSRIDGHLEKLPDHIRTREENALYQRSLLGDVGGVSYQRQRQDTEARTYFDFAFRYDKDVNNSAYTVRKCLTEYSFKKLSYISPQTTLS